MTQRRPRKGPRLSPEERALWREVTRDAVPLSSELRRAVRSPDAGPADAEPPDGQPPDPRPFEVRAPDRAPDPARGPAEDAAPNAAPPGAPAARRVLRPTGPSGPPGRPPGVDLAAPAVAPVAPPGRPTPGLDRRTAERIRRGTRAPEARIDLHGLTAERAHRALDACIAGALARGQRLVLVITGKGGRSESPGSPFSRPGEGVLRREAPRWLRAGPHAGDIVGIFEAHRRHGGAGAFYVYLKKRR